MRRIPAVMATQHPDNVCPPYWKTDGKSFVSAAEEVDECYHMFCDLGCDEYMWDWEGKFVDEAVVDRLFYKFEDYFRKNQIGRDKFLTFRIPNIWKEKGIRLARAFMGILTAAQTAHDLGVNTPPLFEVILPMTSSASQLITIVKKFKDFCKYEKQIFNQEIFKQGRLSLIPLIEGSISLLDSRPLLEEYVTRYRKIFGHTPKYLRPFIARSDPALDAGFIPATLAARVAISEYYRFQKETKIPVFPIIGAGSLRFRGHLSPVNPQRFLDLYAGIRTVTVQSSFRYDHPQEQVKKAIRFFQRKLPEAEPVRFSEAELKEMEAIIHILSKVYRRTIQQIAGTINDLAPYVPKNRERIPHTGHFGYSRKLSGGSVELPRAITFTAVLYSLGVPPTLIGTGRGLQELKKKGLDKKLEKYFPGLREDLIDEGLHFNPENLELLIRRNAAWKTVAEDIQILEEFCGTRFGPHSSPQYIYRNLTSSVLHYWIQGKKPELKDLIIRAASYRHSLG